MKFPTGGEPDLKVDSVEIKESTSKREARDPRQRRGGFSENLEPTVKPHFLERREVRMGEGQSLSDYRKRRFLPTMWQRSYLFYKKLRFSSLSFVYF